MQTPQNRREILEEEPGVPDEDEGVYDLNKAVRGKYFGRHQRSAINNLVIKVAPDVARAFPTEEAVNQALREILAAREKDTAMVAIDGGGAA